MELWQVKRRYRLLAVRLRRLKTTATEVLQAEEQVLVALLQGDRLETELAVLRMARRCTKARLRRMQVWLGGTVLLLHTPMPLVLGDEGEALDFYEAQLGRVGAAQAVHVAQQLRRELSHLDARQDEVKGRLQRLGSVAGHHLECLVRSLRAGLGRHDTATLEPPSPGD